MTKKPKKGREERREAKNSTVVPRVDWYDENIEPGIRVLVRLMRDNGFNTESSCEHKMYVQFQVMDDGRELSRLDHLLFNHGYRDYRIEYELARDDGHLLATATVYLRDKEGNYPVQQERISALEQFYMHAREERREATAKKTV